MLQTWRKIYAKSEATQAYSLLSPALILVAVAMLVPMILMLSFSFFTQVSMMEIDFTPTFQRYIDFFQKSLIPQNTFLILFEYIGSVKIHKKI